MNITYPPTTPRTTLLGADVLAEDASSNVAAFVDLLVITIDNSASARPISALVLGEICADSSSATNANAPIGLFLDGVQLEGGSIRVNSSTFGACTLQATITIEAGATVDVSLGWKAPSGATLRCNRTSAPTTTSATISAIQIVG